MTLDEMFADWRLELIESFDTHADIEWQNISGGIAGIFEVNTVRYVVMLSIPTITPVAGKRVAEVSFYLYDADSDDVSYSTAELPATAPMIIYGIVYNAAMEHSDKFDGLYFTAQKRHSSGSEYDRKVRIYLAMAKKTRGEVYIKSDSLGTDIITMWEPLETKGSWKRYPVDTLDESKVAKIK